MKRKENNIKKQDRTHEACEERTRGMPRQDKKHRKAWREEKVKQNGHDKRMRGK